MVVGGLHEGFVGFVGFVGEEERLGDTKPRTRKTSFIMAITECE
jgi:hypothetical protein